MIEDDIADIGHGIDNIRRDIKDVIDAIKDEKIRTELPEDCVIGKAILDYIDNMKSLGGLRYDRIGYHARKVMGLTTEDEEEP